MPGPLRTVGPLLPKYPTGGAMKQAGSNHKKPLLRIWLERGSLRPLHTRLGSELINVLPVWLGAVSRTGCPVASVAIAVSLHPLAATSAHTGMLSPKGRPRPNGRRNQIGSVLDLRVWSRRSFWHPSGGCAGTRKPHRKIACSRFLAIFTVAEPIPWSGMRKVS